MEWKDKAIDFVMNNGPKVLGAVVIVAAGWIVASWVSRFVERALEKKQLEPPVRMLIGRVMHLLVFALSLVIALDTVGFKMTTVIAAISVAGVGVGLAMQSVLGNLVAGLTIIFTKPFRVGEYIDLLGEEGVVDRVELFTTTLLHADRSHVVIPNRKIVGEVLHNYGTIRQLNLTVGVAYDSNLAEALSAVREVLNRNARVLKDPAPVVGVTMLADSSINVAVKPWVAVGDFGPAQAEIYQGIVEQFRSSKVEIPFPQREVRMLDAKTG
jgi:small conductance mechanosensitive channel